MTSTVAGILCVYPAVNQDVENPRCVDMCRLFSFRNHRISMSFLPRAPFSQKLAAVEAAHHRGFVRWLGRPYGSSQDGSGYHETPAMDLGYRNWALSVACVLVYIHIYIYVHMCVQTRTRTHTHTYIYI